MEPDEPDDQVIDRGESAGASRRVIVVGLGPAGAELVTSEAAALLTDRHPAFLRTVRHPAADAFPDVPAFDEIYESAASLDEVYPAIVARLLDAAAEHGTVVYGVPGSPLVAERTVELLRQAAAADPNLTVEVRPALSFLDLVWDRVGADPVAVGVRVIDGQRFAVEAAGERGPLLVAQCDSVDVLSDVKLAIGEAIDTSSELGSGLARQVDGERGLGVVADLRDADDLRVVVLQRLGLPDEHVVEVAWHDLDREVQPDHLTSLWIPSLIAPVAGEVQRFAELVATLRRECPWDREQTHATLRRHLLEEAYEVLDALADLGDEDPLDLDPSRPDRDTAYANLEEELGDLLFQIVFHSTIAAEEGRFTLADVARGVHDKLYSRHPHVFGDGTAETSDDVLATWEQNKKAEKGRASVFEGIPATLPSLLFALKVQKKAASLGEMGEDLPSPGSWDHVVTSARRAPTDESIGDLLFAVVNMARHAGIDPEMSLRSAASRYRDLVHALEH